MVRKVIALGCFSMALVAVPALSLASPGNSHIQPNNGRGHDNHHGNGFGHHKDAKIDKGKATSVPELDPAAGTAALALLAGGTLIMMSRRRRAAEA